MKRKNRFHLKVAMTVLFSVFSLAIFAQNLTVNGTVVDPNNEPIIGASVSVVGNVRQSTITNNDGKFTLSNVPSDAVLKVSYIGMQPQEVSVNGQKTVNVTMQEDTKALNEVVVTALGLKREKKALGYAVQDVKSDELTKVGTPDVANSLQGKVAGLNINTSGTGVGGSTKIVIRGNSSLSENNEPLWIIDGIPFSNETEKGNWQWGGYDRAGKSFDLNPNDVESISVLKGPTAAALYGSRAGNGVILVTTKKGRAQKGLGISYNGTFTISPVAYFLDMQDKYGQGSTGVFNGNMAKSWGAEMSGQAIPSWWDNTKSTTYSVQKDVIKNYFQTANTQSHNISLTGANEKGSFRASIGSDRMNGNYIGNSVSKTNFDLVSTYAINNFLDVEAKASYVNTKGAQRPLLGFYSSTRFLYEIPRNIKLTDLNEHKFNAAALSAGNYEEQNWLTTNADRRNPYYQQEQFQNNDKRDRFFGYAQANIKFTENFNLRLKHGMDFYAEKINYIYKWSDNIYINQNPSINITQSASNEQNSEFLFTYNQTFNDFSLGLSAGGNRMYSKREGIYGSSGQLPVTGKYYLSLGTNQSVNNFIYEKQVNSLYGFLNLGYKDFLYLDVTGRNDWSSTLPAKNRSYFYPSVSLSALVTEAMDEFGILYPKNIISYGKIRASYARVGKDTDPYQLALSYGTGKEYNLLFAFVPTVLPNVDLMPEIATSYEFGTEWKFFGNRLGFDFTYYNTKTANQALNIPTTLSTGYESRFTNVGLISNKGIELMLTGTPVKSNDFSLDLALNFAKNTTLVEKLDEKTKMFPLGELNNGIQVVAIEGHKFGEIYGFGYKTDVAGNKIIKEGIPVKTDSKVVLGCVQPDFAGSFSIGADYKGIFISTLFSFQKGGQVYSLTEAMASGAGNSLRTLERTDKVIEGVLANGSKNTQSISAQQYWENGTTPQEFIYDASFLKLKELSVGYNIPKQIISSIAGRVVQSFRISLVGSNLLYLIKHTPGTTPDGSALSSNVFSQAIDFSPMPNTRTFGLSINVGF